MGPSSRRVVAALVRVGLVVLVIALVSGYVMRRMPHRMRGSQHVSVQREAPPAESLGPGDLRIYSADSSVDIVLQGDRILAGLSPKMIAKIKHDMEKPESGDSTGLGASISQMVKKRVANAIGIHAVYPLSKIRDIRHEDDRIVLEWKDGGTQDVFGGTKVDGENVSHSFRSEDADRFVQAVRARMAMPPMPPAPPAPSAPRP